LVRRDLVRINVTTHPTAEWIARQITVCTENWIRLDARQRLGNPALDDRVTPTDPPYHSLAFQTENEARGRNPSPSPTAQRASPTGIEATTTQQYRSLSVCLALSLVPFRPQRDCNSPPRDDHPLAPRGVPVVLARAVTQAGWQAENFGRAAQSHRRDEPCKSPLGCTTHPWRTAQARFHNRAVNGRTLYVPGLAAIAGLADLSDQPCRRYRGNRPLRAADEAL